MAHKNDNRDGAAKTGSTPSSVEYEAAAQLQNMQTVSVTGDSQHNPQEVDAAHALLGLRATTQEDVEAALILLDLKATSQEEVEAALILLDLRATTQEEVDAALTLLDLKADTSQDDPPQN